MSKRPGLLAVEYELDGDAAIEHFETAFEVFRNAIAQFPPLTQPFNVSLYVDDAADQASEKLFGRPCLPPGQTVEGRTGEAP
jgi:murein tripeptide amidase MpaA